MKTRTREAKIKALENLFRGKPLNEPEPITSFVVIHNGEIVTEIKATTFKQERENIS